MRRPNIKDPNQIKAKKLLYALVFFLVFEGLIRKLVPASLSLIVFFMKDILCVIGIFYIRKARLVNWLSVVNSKWKSTLSIFIPVLLITLVRGGPVLMLFGLKQYLLYMVAGLLVPIAFPVAKFDEFKTFIFLIVVSLFPTVGVAILQNALPPGHWLNLSVDGSSLEAFSAAGHLRVSSTFSFTGQFSWYLNMACSCLVLMLLLPKDADAKPASLIQRLCIMGAVMSLFIGVFITGGRTAVLGCAFNIGLGFAMAATRSPGKLVKRGAIAGLVLLVGTGAVRVAKPEYFAAYDARSQGYGGRTQAEEIQQRVEDGFLGWTKWAFRQDGLTVMLGNGLGVMSNGSEKLSSYANLAKQSTFIESDFDVTVWEGGLYLLVVWYAFRIWIILFCLKLWRGIKNKDWAVVASFLVSYVILNATLSAIGKQPPLNIWLWLVVGCLITIKNYNEYIDRSAQKAKKVLRTALTDN